MRDLERKTIETCIEILSVDGVNSKHLVKNALTKLLNESSITNTISEHVIKIGVVEINNLVMGVYAMKHALKEDWLYLFQENPLGTTPKFFGSCKKSLFKETGVLTEGSMFYIDILAAESILDWERRHK